MKRPKSVAIIGRLLIILACVGMGGMVLVIGSSLEEGMEFLLPIVAIMVIAVFIQIVMGIGILKGKNWARLLYLWLTPISIVIGVLRGSLGPMGGVKIILFAVVAYFLTRPNVKEYFRKTPVASLQPDE